MAKEKQGEILPFKRTTESYLRGARKLLDEGDLLGSLTLLRKGEAEHEEDWGAYRIAEAHVLNQMQRFEHSLRVLLTAAPLEELPEEAVFGAAENFLALEEFNAAHVCLELYLKQWPKGFYAANCVETLHLLHSGDDLSWHLGLEEGEDAGLIAHIHYAKAMHFSQRDQQSLEYLLKVEETYPNSLWLQMEIALDQFCVEEYAQAEQRVFNILKKDRGYVRARCLLALIRLTEHKEREAREMMDSIPIPTEGSSEELGTMCAMLLEVEDYERAEACAGLLLEQIPYDTMALHEMAFAKAMQGKSQEARELYETIEKIDPEDTVADHYVRLLKLFGKNVEYLKTEMTTNYDVSYSEAIERFNDIKQYLKRPLKQILKVWQSDEQFERLLRWAVYSPLFQAKPPLFELLGKLGDVRAHDILVDFLLRMDQGDQEKQLAIVALQDMGDEGPYSLYIEGMWRYGKVKTVALPEDLPSSYQELFRELSQVEEKYHLPKGIEAVAQRIFYHYVEVLAGDYPRMNREQRQAMLAALSIMAQQVVGESEIDVMELTDRFGVSLRRLHNALDRLMWAVRDVCASMKEDMKENGEEDPE